MSNTSIKCPKCGNVLRFRYRHGKTFLEYENGDIRAKFKLLGSIYHCNCTGKVFEVRNGNIINENTFRNERKS